MQLLRDETDDTATRQEAQAFAARPVALDPYAAWLAQREAERRLQEGERVRWVYRYPRVQRQGPQRVTGPQIRARRATDESGDTVGRLLEA